MAICIQLLIESPFPPPPLTKKKTLPGLVVKVFNMAIIWFCLACKSITLSAYKYSYRNRNRQYNV